MIKEHIEALCTNDLINRIKEYEYELTVMESIMNERASSVEGEQNRKFAMISTAWKDLKSSGVPTIITTVSHIDAAKVFQDGEWKKVAFPTMMRECHITITEDVVRNKNGCVMYGID